MEISKKDMRILKGVAILFMLLLHLFARKEINGLYVTFPEINVVPLVYYIGLFGDACVPMYLFASGYGLFISLEKEQVSKFKKNIIRIFKLLINYWIILFIFVTIGFLVVGKVVYPVSLTELILNIFVIKSSYNGAWWFVQTYIMLVLLAPFIFSIVKKYNSLALFIVSGLIYFVSYVQRIKPVIEIEDPIIAIVVNAIVLVGTSQFSFIVGALFVKEQIYSRFYKRFHAIKMKNILSVVGILALVFIHSLYESMIIAPLTAFAFILLFTSMDKSDGVKKVFGYFGDHSTNIWLTHMFFYITIFPELTFAPKYPILIFIWLIVLCLAASYVINLIYKPIIKLIDRKLVVSVNIEKPAS